ncbi:MAG: M23 family metallopeptidase [Pseudomonadales bacterium]
MRLIIDLLPRAVVLTALLVTSVSTSSLEMVTKVQQGAVLLGQLSDDEQAVYLGEQLLPLSADRRFIVGLDRDHGDEVTLSVIGRDGQRSEHRYTVRARDYRIQRVEGIARKIMNPNPDDLSRIRKESTLVREARAQRSDQESFLQPFVWPIKGPITGVYGSQRVYNGVPGRPHYGVDVAAPVGAKVRAPAAGTVRLAHDNMFYSGGTLIIDHGHGLSSSFLHLSKILVEPGQQLMGGEIVAEVGATGRATGPHLDWRMNWRDARVDPELLVPPMIQSKPD